MNLERYLDILTKSIWVFHCNSGSCNGCDIEIVASITPRYDIERFGMKLVGSPRHADALLKTTLTLPPESSAELVGPPR